MKRGLVFFVLCLESTFGLRTKTQPTIWPRDYYSSNDVTGLEAGLGQLTSKKIVECQVVILGAGIAGAYSAYKLANLAEYKNKVCVVEKLTRIGGRIHDVPEKPGGPVYALGALRVPIGHLNMVQLGRELGIEMALVGFENVFFKVRGRNFYTNGTVSPNAPTQFCNSVFVGLNCSSWNNSDTDRGMWNRIFDLYQRNPEMGDYYIDFNMFIRALVGDEGYWMLADSCPFRSFTAPGISVEAVMTHFLRSEKPNKDSFLGPKYYPVGGMSQYPERMIKIAHASGVRVYLGQTVTSINSHEEDRFVVETGDAVFHADKIINTIVPGDFVLIEGNVASSIKSSPEFQAIVPTPIAVVNTYWNDRWWEQSKMTGGLLLNRVSGHETCFDKMEIQNYPYVRDQNVTRSVYDDGACVDTWRAAISRGRTDLLIAEIVAALQRVFTDVEVPEPRSVIASMHERAWHSLAALSSVTTKEQTRWAARPLGMKTIAMVGEAYHAPHRAWCEGAILSADTALVEQYGFNFPCLDSDESSADCTTTS